VILRRSRNRLLLHLAGLFTVTLLIFGLAWVSSKRFLILPLARLSEVSDRLAAGDLSERTGLDYTGDIGRLAQSFDTMAESLQREKEAGGQMLESLRALTARLDSIGEEERTRIAREFHDELGQQLTAVRFELDSLARNPSPEVSNRAFDLIALVDAAGDEVRRIATELRPAALDYGCLCGAIEALVRDFARRTGIECTIETPDRVQLGNAAATCLFRICQESLTNVARHALAAHVKVVLRSDAEDFTLTVCDDGQGFIPGAGNSLGLLGMRERARIVGGHFRIESSPHKGTTVTIRIPITDPPVRIASVTA
jgi:signal transduction histidine kinase